MIVRIDDELKIVYGDWTNHFLSGISSGNPIYSGWILTTSHCDVTAQMMVRIPGIVAES